MSPTYTGAAPSVQSAIAPSSCSAAQREQRKRLAADFAEQADFVADTALRVPTTQRGFSVRISEHPRNPQLGVAVTEMLRPLYLETTVR